MNKVDFVFIDGIAIGMLVADNERWHFYGASQTLEDLDGRTFTDAEEAQSFVSRRLRRLAVGAGSGEMEVTGSEMARIELCEAANAALSPVTRFSALKH